MESSTAARILTAKGLNVYGVREETISILKEREADKQKKELPFLAEYARDRFIIGDAAFVKEEVARYREALGVDHFMMRCHWPGLEQEKVLGSIRRLAEIFA